MKILFDTNVVLDIMLDRKPFAAAAAMLFSYAENNKLTGFLGATTITTIDYLATKVIGRDKAKVVIENLLELFEIIPINHSVLSKALKSKILDFEDAVLHEAALQAKVQAIVTRDTVDFNKAEIVIYTPRELLEVLAALNKH